MTSHDIHLLYHEPERHDDQVAAGQDTDDDTEDTMTSSITTETACTTCQGTGIGVGHLPDGRPVETDCSMCDGAGLVEDGATA